MFVNFEFLLNGALKEQTKWLTFEEQEFENREHLYMLIISDTLGMFLTIGILKLEKQAKHCFKGSSVSETIQLENLIEDFKSAVLKKNEIE